MDTFRDLLLKSEGGLLKSSASSVSLVSAIKLWRGGKNAGRGD